MRRRLFVVLGVGVVLVLAWHDVSSNWPVVANGGLASESFYRGRPFKYWLHMLSCDCFDESSLRRGGAEAVAVLLEALRQEDVTVRVHALRVLAHIGPEAKAAVPGLVEVLRDEQARVRLGAAAALESIGPAAGAAVPALVHRLAHDANPAVRARVLVVLQALGPEATPGLLEALQDQDPHVRQRAGEALKQVNPETAAQAGVP
jgi:HEAT repeat protein